MGTTKAGEFVERVLGDTASTATVVMAALGDRLGLFKDLAKDGEATSEELAQRSGIHERYAREWLHGMTTAGYLAYDPETHRFSLPSDHVPVLAEEGGPMFFGGVHSELLGMIQVYDQVADSFRTGGGVAQSDYPESVYDDMDRFTSNWHNNLLLQEWIPLLPHIQGRLEDGIAVADVGCGRGRAAVNLAKAFPRSRFVGYDIFEPNLRFATELARETGVGDRVAFEQWDVARALPEKYDLITTFDVLHDAADPGGILRSIREGLKSDGTYLCLDIKCSDQLEENVGPIGAFMYGFSLVYCMTTSLARGGVGLGTMGLPPSTLEAMAEEAGFSEVRVLPLDNPFNNLYELRP
ncbi:MAG: methyltransferase domain-containing protein [Thermoplasmata archaeon]